VQQPVAQFLGFGGCEVAVQEEVLGPGEQVDRGEGELQRGGVDGELVGRDVAQAGFLAAADAVFERAWPRRRGSSGVLAVAKAGRGRMLEGDDELTALRSSRPYSLSVWGLRLLVLAFSFGVATIAFSLVGLSVAAAWVIIATFILGPVGIILAWAGAAALFPKTRRYSRASRSGLDASRVRRLIAVLITDVFRYR
jgi:hypothetical protein